MPHLVNQLSPAGVGLFEDMGPELRILPVHQVAGLSFEHRILIANLDELKVTLPPLRGSAGQTGVPPLAAAAHHAAVEVGVLSQEVLWAAATVHVDPGEGVVRGRLFTAFATPGLQPGKQQLQPLFLFSASATSSSVEKCSSHPHDQVSDYFLITIHVKQPSNHSWDPTRVDLLNVDLDVLLQAVVV